MKPLYIVILLWAVLISLLADGIGGALEAIPVVGTVLGLVVALCVNVTMGAGFLFLLISNGMYHPKFGPFFIIGGFLPGIDFLPFWLGLGVVAILQDYEKEHPKAFGVAGAAIQTALNVESGNIAGAAKSAARGASALGQQSASQDTRPAAQTETRSPIALKSPNINHDIAPKRAANDNLPYVQKTA